MRRAAAMITVFINLGGVAFAGIGAPEIGAASAVAAVTILAGAALIIRNRRRK